MSEELTREQALENGDNIVVFRNLAEYDEELKNYFPIEKGSEGTNSMQQKGAESLSSNALALGNSVAGGKGYKIIAKGTDSDGKAYYILRVKPGDEAAKNIGDIAGKSFSIRLRYAKYNAGTIASVSTVTHTDGLTHYKVRLSQDPGIEIHTDAETRNVLIIKGMPNYGDVNIGMGAMALGNGTYAQDEGAISLGTSSYALGKASLAAGSSTTAGYQAVALCVNSKALGDQSMAIGHTTEARSNGSFAGGYKAIATGDDSFSFGIETRTTNTGEVAFGKYNFTNSNTAFSIGAGESDDNRSNLMTVYNDGRILTKDGDEIYGNMKTKNTMSDAELLKYGNTLSLATHDNLGGNFGITSFKITSKKIKIPLFVNTMTYGIKKIFGIMSMGGSTAEEVVISEGIKCIGMRCFENNSTIKKIILPNSIEKIGNYAFKNCSALEEISLPGGIDFSLGGGYQVIFGCTNLKRIIFRDVPKSLPKNAIYDNGNAKYYVTWPIEDNNQNATAKALFNSSNTVFGNDMSSYKYIDDYRDPRDINIINSEYLDKTASMDAVRARLFS